MLTNVLKERSGMSTSSTALHVCTYSLPRLPGGFYRFTGRSLHEGIPTGTGKFYSLQVDVYRGWMLARYEYTYIYRDLLV